MPVRTFYLLLLLVAATDTFSQTLIPFRKKNGKFIYVDSVTMKPTITREFHDARFFKDGLAYAKIKEDGEFIVIDKTGNNAKAGKYEINSPFDESGTATFKDGDFEGVVDRNGKVLVPAVYEQAFGFYRKDLAMVRQDGLYGFVNKNGVLVVSPQFESWDFFSDGIVFMKEKGEGGGGYFGSDGKWGAINEQGNQVLPFIYGSASEFNNGLAIVEKDEAFIIIDKKGVEQKIPGDYKIVRGFANGFAEVTSNGKVGFINKKFEVAVPIIYDTIGMMNINGRATVALNGKWGLIDSTGKLVAPCKYDRIEAFNARNMTSYTLNGKEGVLHMNGKEVTPPVYESLYVTDSDMIYVQKGGKWGVLNSKGQVVIPTNYEVESVWDMIMAPSHGNTFMFQGVYRSVEGTVYGE